MSKSDAHTSQQSDNSSNLAEFLISRLKHQAEDALGESVQISPSTKQGNLNYSFVCTARGNKKPCGLIKVKDAYELEHTFLGPPAEVYRKERIFWDIVRAHEMVAAEPIGPVWSVHEQLGQRGPFTASMRTFLPGRDGHEIAPHGSTGEVHLIGEIGRLARPLAGMLTKDFGTIPVEGGDYFGLQWAEYVDSLAQTALKGGNEVLEADMNAALHQKIEALRESSAVPCIVHADLHLSNALFNSSNQATALIDWERGCSSIVEEEFARVLYENFILGQRFKNPGEIRKILCANGISPQFAIFLDGYGVSTEDYEKVHREKTEALLAILSVGFFVQYELQLKATRPDWEAPAKYAREAAETILIK